MDASVLAVLNDSERLLVAQTEQTELAGLDEDGAIELETRIRRARNKYVSLYRRGGAAAVAKHGGRGKARPERKRDAQKAEAFEEALARVSRRVSALARQAAAALRAERLSAAAAVRKGRGPISRQAPRMSGKGGPAVTEQVIVDPALRSPASMKRRASTRAQTARRQARKDSR
ncbi:MAG: hypothetical protein J2P28_02425 [Actinobacteria bacterium]|nr:hypothetical protein [Actinomycetota bacterium]MBO0834358.1 hypothetical protein [Actinomycetota bacterium]